MCRKEDRQKRKSFMVCGEEMGAAGKKRRETKLKMESLTSQRSPPRGRRCDRER